MNYDSDPFQGLGIILELKNREDFLMVAETLTRMGIASKYEKVLYQSCHIFHKRGKYAIFHFKEMFKIDGKPTNITEDDIARRNTIANLLYEWGLITLVDPKRSQNPVMHTSQIKILTSEEKSQWKLCKKYNIGGKKFH